MSQNQRQLLGLASLYEQVARAIYEERGPNVIQPGQWSALRYFGRAGQGARNVTGLARFLGVTLGPASRAVGALDRRGLINLRPNPDDGRSQLVDLTQDGQRQLKIDPLKRFAGALGTLEPADRAVFTRIVLQLAEELGAQKEQA